MKATNNHGVWFDAQRLAFALFTEDHKFAKAIINEATSRLDAQLDENGRFPKEMQRTISMHYTAFTLQAFFNIAQMAEKVGINFWTKTTAGGKSLQKAFEAFYPYLSKQKEWDGKQIKPFEFWENYSLLLTAEEKFNCKECRLDVLKQMAENPKNLSILLLY
jgi:hypothetical protein